MPFLPKGEPLSEDLQLSPDGLEAAFENLKTGRLSGTAIFSSRSARSCLLYKDGEITGAVVQKNGKEVKGEEALQALSNLMIMDLYASLSIFRYPDESIPPLEAMLSGRAAFEPTELNRDGFRQLVERVRHQSLTCALTISSSEGTGTALFFKGAPAGFFNDRSEVLSKSPSVIQGIANSPKAKSSLIVANEDLDAAARLSPTADSGIDTAVMAMEETCPDEEMIPPAEIIPDELIPSEVTADIAGMVEKLSGRLGKRILLKHLADSGGITALTDENSKDAFIRAFEKDARLIAGNRVVHEISERLKAQLEVVSDRVRG